MKFLTKEWYSTCQLTDLHVDVIVTQEAEQFDELSYLKLYRHKELEFLKLQEEVYNFDPRAHLEDEGQVFVQLSSWLQQEEVTPSNSMIFQMSDAQKKRVQQQIDEFDGRGPFNPIEASLMFKQSHQARVEFFQTNLPHEVVLQIPDVRLLTLGVTSRSIKKKLQKFAMANQKIVEDAMKNYQRMIEEEVVPIEVLEQLSFHDCQVMQVEQTNHLRIDFDNQGGFTSNQRLIFHEADIIQFDQPLEGAYWLYEEIYPHPKGYEVHVLLSNTKLRELTLICRGISVSESVH